jgi:hypothetical protein
VFVERKQRPKLVVGVDAMTKLDLSLPQPSASVAITRPYLPFPDRTPYAF